MLPLQEQRPRLAGRRRRCAKRVKLLADALKKALKASSLHTAVDEQGVPSRQVAAQARKRTSAACGLGRYGSEAATVRVWTHEAQSADRSSPPTGASVSRGATMPCSWLVRGGVGAPTHAAALNPEVRAAGIGLQDGRRDSCSIQPIACHGPTWSTFGMQGKLEAVSAAAGASKASPL
jgi:hypothetical protein